MVSILIWQNPASLRPKWLECGPKGFRNKGNLILSKGECCSKVVSGSIARNGHMVQPYWQKLDQDSEMAELAHRAQNTSKLESMGIHLLYYLRATSSWNRKIFWPGILLWICQHDWDCQSCPRFTENFGNLSLCAGSAGQGPQEYQLRIEIGALWFLDCQSCPQNQRNTGTCSDSDQTQVL